MQERQVTVAGDDSIPPAVGAALARGDTPAAARLADAAVAAGHGHPLLLQLAALQREEAGDFGGAHALLARALQRLPGEPALLVAVAAVWRRAGDPGEALRILDAMVAHGLDHAPTWLERGHALLARNAYAEAQASYARAAACDPAAAPAHAGLAEAALRTGDAAAAAEHAARALALDPANLVAANAAAAAALDRGEPEAARDRLAAALARTPPSEPGLVETLTLLGDAHDRLDDTAAAWDAYARAQALHRALTAPRFGDERRGQSALIAHVAAQVAAADPARWRPLDATGALGPARGHVFLLGYPRSGTTLIENVLAGLPEVVAIEEKPTLAAAEASLVAAPDAAARLAALDQPGADALRAAYWAEVARHADAAGGVLVDMNPMRAPDLPAIARLFPDARIVVMRRDPRDVVWSAFRRHFAPSPTSYALSDLAATARHYAALMALTQACLERLPLTAHVLRYEDVVADFDAATAALCAFVGVPWREEVRRFDRTAARRGVTTASGRQLRRGLFDGRRQWERYADRLAPVLPILAPWIERFGYA